MDARMTLTGQLVCADHEQAQVVLDHLPEHVELTRAEPGCISFEVHRTDDPLVWQVDEVFVDAEAFAVHQQRVAASRWGRVTAAVERRYRTS